MARSGTVCARCGAVHFITPEIWHTWEMIDGKWYCPTCKNLVPRSSGRVSSYSSHGCSSENSGNRRVAKAPAPPPPAIAGKWTSPSGNEYDVEVDRATGQVFTTGHGYTHYYEGQVSTHGKSESEIAEAASDMLTDTYAPPEDDILGG